MPDPQQTVQPPLSTVAPKITQVAKEVQKSIPQPVNQKVQEGVAVVKQTAPQVRQEVVTYAKDFRLTLLHLIFLGYFLAIFLRILMPFSFDNLTNFTFWRGSSIVLFNWLLGGLIGWNLLFLDNVVYLYITYPESQATKEAKFLLANKGIVEWFKFLLTFKVPQKQAFRSVLFQVAWVALAFFALTSTASYLGKGVVVGLGLHLLLENWQLQRKNPAFLNSRLFWQIKRKVSLKEQKYYLWLFTALFALLSILV